MPKKITEVSLAASLAPADNPTFYVEKGGVFRRVSLAQLEGCLNEGITATSFSAETAYSAGDYVVYNGQLYCFTADHAAGVWTGTDASACTMADEVSHLKSQLQAMFGDRMEWSEPENWFDYETITIGTLKADGTVTSDTTHCYTDFIPVSGWTKVVWLRGDNMTSIYVRNRACYDADKQILPGKGSNSSSSGGYNVDSDVAYVRLTFDYSASILTVIQKIIIAKNTAPTKWTKYFAPFWKITEDFLTDASNTIFDQVKNNKYACSYPITVLRQTVGIPEKFYGSTGITPDKTCYYNIMAGVEYSTKDNTGIIFDNITEYTSINGYTWKMLNANFGEVKSYIGSGVGGARRFIAENLSNCSLLAIGDSTVDQDVMTQKLLDYFTLKNKTITLLGTLGADGNYNEGRAGWKASDYLTNRVYSVDGRVNPFYNPSTQTFDFAYYMTNQGYSAPDFVVIQLGINDLGSTDDYASIWACIKTMIDSIRSYNNSIKILLNLPTTPTSDQSKISASLPVYKNRVVSYDEYAITHSLSEYGETAVRTTYCHLILDPDTDIYDNVHPNAGGYEKMALEIVNQINHWQNNS